MSADENTMERIAFVREQLQPTLEQAAKLGVSRAEIIIAICSLTDWHEEGVSLAVIKDSRTSVREMAHLACLLVDCASADHAVHVAERTACWIMEGMPETRPTDPAPADPKTMS